MKKILKYSGIISFICLLSLIILYYVSGLFLYKTINYPFLDSYYSTPKISDISVKENGINVLIDFNKKLIEASRDEKQIPTKELILLLKQVNSYNYFYTEKNLNRNRYKYVSHTADMREVLLGSINTEKSKMRKQMLLQEITKFYTNVYINYMDTACIAGLSNHILNRINIEKYIDFIFKQENNLDTNEKKKIIAILKQINSVGLDIAIKNDINCQVASISYIPSKPTFMQNLEDAKILVLYNYFVFLQEDTNNKLHYLPINIYNFQAYFSRQQLKTSLLDWLGNKENRAMKNLREKNKLLIAKINNL